MKTYTLDAQEVTKAPLSKQGRGSSFDSSLHKRKSLLIVAHSRPMNLAAVNNSRDVMSDMIIFAEI